MDHIVYLDKKSDELGNLLNGSKDIVLRGATGRKLPYGRCNDGDTLYFVNNNGEGVIKAKGTVKSALFTDKLSKEDSMKTVDDLLNRILLQDKTLNRFRGKRYLSIIEVHQVVAVEPFTFDKSNYSNMDDWLLVEDITKVISEVLL